MEKKQKLDYMNYFRGFAILLIVAGHSLVWGKPGGAVQLTNRLFFQDGTYFFIFIAVFLFQYLSYKFNVKIFFKKKFLNVFLPYLIVLTPAALIFAITDCNPANPLFDLPKIIKFITCYPFPMLINAPLWFMGMIGIIYLISPLLLKISKNKIAFGVFIVLYLIYSACNGRANFVKIVYLSNHLSYSEKYMSYLLLYFKNTLFFLSVYSWGMFCCQFIEHYKYNIKEISKIIASYSFILLLFLYFILIVKLHLLDRELVLVRFIEINLFLSLFILIENWVKKHQLLEKTLNTLASYSFGIFFIHQYFINIYRYHSLYDTYKMPIVSIAHNSSSSLLNALFTFIFALGGSILTIFLVKKVLTKLGVKNTRMFIGVENSSRKCISEGRGDKTLSMP